MNKELLILLLVISISCSNRGVTKKEDSFAFTADREASGDNEIRRENLVDSLSNWLDRYMRDTKKPKEFLLDFADSIDLTFENLGEYFFEINGEVFSQSSLYVVREEYPYSPGFLEIRIKPDSGLSVKELKKHWGEYIEVPPPDDADEISTLFFNNAPVKNGYKYSPSIFVHRSYAYGEGPIIIAISILRDPLRK